MSDLLELRDVHAHYGLSHVLQGVTLGVGHGEVVTLLGRNGAGKTTTLRTIIGLVPASAGRVSLDGQNVTRFATHRIASLGVAYVPSGRRTWSGLSVRQNLMVAGRSAGMGADSWTVERVYSLFPDLRKLDGRRSETLSGGQQQMLKLGRALVTNPRLLLLDEPTEGLAPIVVGSLAEWLMELRSSGLSMILAEQNVSLALRVAGRGYILDKGQIGFAGSSDELRHSPDVEVHLTA